MVTHKGVQLTPMGVADYAGVLAPYSTNNGVLRHLQGVLS